MDDGFVKKVSSLSCFHIFLDVHRATMFYGKYDCSTMFHSIGVADPFSSHLLHLLRHLVHVRACY